MLRELRIRNFAVVENVTVPFAPGLNVLTGETGAGKSILVDAILLVRGARAQTDVIRADAESATVEAVFAVPDGGVAAALDEAGLTVEEEEVGTLLQDDAASAAARLARATRVLTDLGRLDPAFGAPVEMVEAARVQVDETLAAVRALRDTIVFEPGRLEAIDDRLDALKRLARKYGDSEEAMLRFRAEAAAELDRLERHEELLGEDERRLADLELEMTSAARALGAARREAAAKLAPAVQRELRQLGMERATFEVAVIEAALAEWGPRGAERVEFGFTANPGEPVRPLARIASGGELARSMLALQVVLSGYERAPTMVFDEVDAGIGGRAASVVGEKLAAVGAGRHILCVTHLAPIAALAHQHVRVAKSVRGGRTRASAEVVAGEPRVAELARMLGDAAGTAALEHARALLRGRGAQGARSRGV